MGCLDFVKYLAKISHTSLYQPDKSGNLPIHYAVRDGHNSDAVKLLLEYDSDLCHA